MLLINMYVINYYLFLNYLILFLQRYKKDKSVIGIKIKISHIGLYVLAYIMYPSTPHTQIAFNGGAILISALCNVNPTFIKLKIAVKPFRTRNRS